MSECNRGKFVFDGNTTYRCTGILSAFGDCNKKVKKPERRLVELPEGFAHFKFLKREFDSKHHRLFKENPKAKAKAKVKSKAAKQSVKPKQGPLTRNRTMLMKGIPNMTQFLLNFDLIFQF